MLAADYSDACCDCCACASTQSKIGAFDGGTNGKNLRVLMKMVLFYQDRLGTNIGKVETKRRSFRRSGPARHQAVL
jgi:hypothetical protein